MATAVATKEQIQELLDSVDYFLLDLDGVVYSGKTVIPQIPETLERLRKAGKHIRFISNTILLKRNDLIGHFQSMGIHGVEPHEIYTAAFASALYVQEKYGAKDTKDHLVHGNVFVLGPVGLHDEIQSVLAPGYVTYGSELNSVPYSPDMVAQAWTEPLLPAPSKAATLSQKGGAESESKIALSNLKPVAVVVGVDYGMNMTQMACAVALLQCTDAGFVATNPDPADPAGPRRLLLPSSGSVIAAVRTAVGREPDVLCGKPSPTMGHLLFEKEEQDGRHVEPQRALMVGDRLMTDIQFGKRVGCRTALALSGAQKLPDLQDLAAEELPDVVIESLADFLNTA